MTVLHTVFPLLYSEIIVQNRNHSGITLTGEQLGHVTIRDKGLAARSCLLNQEGIQFTQKQAARDSLWKADETQGVHRVPCCK